MRYTTLEPISVSNSSLSQRGRMHQHDKKWKKIFVVANGKEQLWRKRDQLKQWIKIMQWALICYLPQQQLNRSNVRLYLRRARIEKTRIMNEMVFEATPIHMSNQSKSAIPEQSVVFEEYKTRRTSLNQSQDIYLHTFLDEKCLTYPSSQQKSNPYRDNL